MKGKVIYLSLVIMILISVINIGFCADTVLYFTGGSIGGSYELHGAAIADIVHRDNPDIYIDYKPGAGLANVMIISEGKADLGFTHSVVAKAALLGEEPFEKPQPGLRALCTTYDSRIQIIALADYGVDSISQLVEEKRPVRISVGNRGSVPVVAAQRLFEEYGITFEDIISWGGKIIYKEMTEACDLMKLNKLDVQFITGACPLGCMNELKTVRNLKLLSVDEEIIAKLEEKYGYGKSFITPANYDFVKENTPTFAVMTTVLAREDLSEDIAYRVTKAIGDNLEYFYSVDEALKVVSKDSMWQGAGVPLHPGAERYYREIGVIK